MLALLSPSKTQDFSVAVPEGITPTQPALLDESKILVKQLQGYSESEIGKLMNISDKLAKLNADRYQDFTTPFTPKNAKPAVLAFKGDVYDGLDAKHLSPQELECAQHSLRMLSGLYGVLKPLDLMQAYRLEMGTKLENERGKNLYDFWDDRLTMLLNQHLKEEKTDTVINLASNEYFSAVNPKKLDGKLITVHFKDEKDGKLRVVGLFAKRARGMMARYIVKENAQSPEDLHGFSEAGYRFRSDLSTEHDFVFARKQPTR